MTDDEISTLTVKKTLAHVHNKTQRGVYSSGGYSRGEQTHITNLRPGCVLIPADFTICNPLNATYVGV